MSDVKAGYEFVAMELNPVPKLLALIDAEIKRYDDNICLLARNGHLSPMSNSHDRGAVMSLTVLRNKIFPPTETAETARCDQSPQ